MTEVKEEPAYKALMADVSDIASKVVYPRDPWGFTSELKAAITKTVGRMNDNADKQELVIGVLMVALAHVRKRKNKDIRLAKARNEQINSWSDNRKPRERFAAIEEAMKETQ